MKPAGEPWPFVGETRARGFGAAKWTMVPDDVLALTVAEMDVEPDPFIIDGLRDFIGTSGLGYGGPRDTAHLGKALAGWFLRDTGLTIDPDGVFPVGTVKLGMEAAVAAFSSPDSPLIILSPCYPPFFLLVEQLGRRCIEVELVQHGATFAIDFDALEAALSVGRATLLLCHPSNPTGQSYSTADLVRIAELVDRHDGRVISDEVHAPMVFAPLQHVPYAMSCEAAARHSVTIMGASKGWNIAGLKSAQVVTTNDEDRAVFATTMPLVHFSAARAGVVGSTLAYSSDSGWRSAVHDALVAKRQLLCALLEEQLPGVVLADANSTYLAWMDFRALGLPEEPGAFFLEHARVALNSGAAFGAGGAGWARFNFAASNQVLGEAVRRMAAAVEQATRDAAPAVGAGR